MAITLTGKFANVPQRQVFYFMHALGRDALPERVEAAGHTFQIVEFVKHDFFAATGFYKDATTGEMAVLKIARTQSFLGLPMQWLGRTLARRELHFYKRLSDLPNVPQIISRVGTTGFLHTYVHGRPLEKGLAIPDDFFDNLIHLVDTLAARGIALVDTNKPENLLVGDDGQPYAIDFQISYDAASLGGIWPAKLLLRAFERSDVYHVLKQKKRFRPDLLCEREKLIVDRPAWPIRLHRRLTRPYFIVRRRLFARLRASGRLMPEGSK